MMDAFGLVFDGSIVAAGRILRKRNDYKSFDYDLFQTVARPILKGSYDKLIAEWETATSAIVSDDVLRQFVNAQSIELGELIADAYHEEMVWRN